MHQKKRKHQTTLLEERLLTKKQFQILKYLYTHSNFRNICSRINKGIDATYSFCSVNLYELYILGLVYSEKRDGRSKTWHLTNKGKELIKIYFKMEVLING